ncbi:unnamed protein product [Alopecurus aequalis]
MALSSRRAVHLLNSSRGISSTPHLASFGWFEKLKQHQLYARITGKKPHEWPSESFTLLKFADSMDKARKLGNFSSFMSGRPADSSTVGPAMEKHAAVLRYLATIDPHAEKLTSSDKASASKHCDCTIVDVEHILAKYTWAKEAQKKMERLHAEGRPMPKSMSEVQKIMGNTPFDIGNSNLAKSGQISRNALCPCGSKKRYKRCCGTS